MKKIRIALLIMLSALLMQGCRFVSIDLGIPFNDEKLLHKLQGRLESMYPESFRAVHRVILTAANRQFDLEGYILIKRPGMFRLVAKGGMGGNAFDVLGRSENSARIVTNPSGMRPEWIEKGATRDIAVLYLCSTWPDAFLVRHKEGSVGIARELPGSIREEFYFGVEEHNLESFVISRNGKCLYRMEVVKERVFSPLSNPVPSVLRIEDFELGYDLSIRVIDLRAAKLEDKLFGAVD